MPNLLSHDLGLVLFGSFQQIIGEFWAGVAHNVVGMRGWK
jgi:hypothetical protein